MTRVLPILTACALAWWLGDVVADIARDGVTRDALSSLLFAGLWLAGMRGESGRA